MTSNFLSEKMPKETLNRTDSLKTPLWSVEFWNFTAIFGSPWILGGQHHGQGTSNMSSTPRPSLKRYQSAVGDSSHLRNDDTFDLHKTNDFINFSDGEVINTLVLIMFLFSLLTAGFMLLLFTVRTWSERGRRRRRQPSAPQLSPTRPTYQETAFQTSDTFLSESDGVVTKKRLSDSPPPYECPPDYHSLPPEILMDARSLEDLCQQPRSSDDPCQILKAVDGTDDRRSELFDDQCKQSSSGKNHSYASLVTSPCIESDVRNVDHISHESSSSSTTFRVTACQPSKMINTEMPEISSCRKSPTMLKRASQISKFSIDSDVIVHKRRTKKKYELRDIDASTSSSVPMLGCKLDDSKQDLDIPSEDSSHDQIVTLQGDMVFASFSDNRTNHGKNKAKESEVRDILDRLELNFPHNSYDYVPRRANRRLQFTLKIPSLAQIHDHHGDRSGSSSLPLIPYFSPARLQSSGDENQSQIQNKPLTEKATFKTIIESTPEPQVPSTDTVATDFPPASAQLSVDASFGSHPQNRLSKSLNSSGDSKCKTVQCHSSFSIKEETTFSSSSKHSAHRGSVSPSQQTVPSSDSTSRTTSPMDSIHQTSLSSSPPAYEEIYLALARKAETKNDNEISESDRSNRVQFTISL